MRWSRLLIPCWLVAFSCGVAMDTMFGLRVYGVGAMMFAYLPLLMSRRLSWLWSATALTVAAIVLPFLVRPETLGDSEEVAGRLLSMSFALGMALTGTLFDRWARRLAVTEGRLRTMVSAVSGVLWYGERDANFHGDQRQWTQFTGQSETEFEGQGWIDAVHPDDRGRLRESWFLTDPNVWPERLEQQVRVWHAPSQQWRWVMAVIRPIRDERGKVREWVGMLMDVHQQLTAANDAAQRIREMSALQRIGKLGIWHFDPKRSIVKVSKEVAAAVGMSEGAGEYSVPTLLGLFTGEDRERADGALVELLSQAEPSSADRPARTPGREFTLVLPDGSKRTCFIYARHWVDASGEPQIYGILQDVTDRAVMVSRSKIIESQLLQAKRLQTVGELSSGLAHDVNNMLASILGYAELARLQVEDDDTQLKGYLDQVLAAGHRARELIGTLMTFGRGVRADETQREGVREVELSPLIDETVKLMQASLPTGIDVKVFAPHGIWARVRRVHLQEALLNLCINARDAIGSHGEIRIEIEQGSGALTCASCGRAVPAGGVVLTVRDSGSGIDPAHASRIFDPFFSTKASGEGTGLGLAMVNRLVHEDGGHVILDSQPGRTCFSLVFPESGDDATNAAKPPVKETRLLVVDDDEAIGRLIAAAVEQQGNLAADVYSDPREALEAFLRDPDEYGLLVTDLTMAGMSGVELAAAVRQSRRVPALLITGGAIRDEELWASGEFSGILRKPFSTKEFLKLVIATLPRR